MVATSCLAGCPAPVSLAPDAAVVDECAGTCVAVEGSAGGRLVSDRDGVLFEGEIDGPVCTGPLSPGVHGLTWEDAGRAATATIDVRPFGYGYGLDRPAAALGAIPWTPAVEGLEDEPILAGDPEAWDAVSAMAPALLPWDGGEILFYAGTADEHYALGFATRSGPAAPFEKHPNNPILWPGPPGTTDGSWKNWAQNTPEPERVGDELWLYYNGQAVSDGRLSIGLATGAAPESLVDRPENPVLAGTGDPDDWDGRGVAHPSIVQRDGVFELWYASGTTFALGYALSADGLRFERYCHNPVFTGLGTESWDEGHVKAPEVWFDEAHTTYFMTYSGCDKGCYQVGWAASAEGTRWIAAPDPILPAGASTFAAQATREAYVDVKDGVARFVYTGNDGEIERIGLASAVVPAP